MAPPARWPAERLGCAARFCAGGAACADVGWRRFPVRIAAGSTPPTRRKPRDNSGYRGFRRSRACRRESDLLDLDLDVDAGGEVEALERLDGLRGRLHDVDEALVDAHLEMLAGVLVDVRRPDHAEAADLGRERHRAVDLGLGAHDRLDDLLRRLVDDLVVVGLEPDPDLLTSCVCHAPSCPSGSSTTC